MRSRLRGALWALLGVEFLLGIAAIGWRMSRPAPPAANLSRLPAATAADLRRLQQRVATDRPAAWTELGEAFLAYGYFPEAEACLRRAAMQAPRSFAAVYAHAWSLDRLCRLPEAEAQFQAAAALTAGETAGNCWYHIGLNHLRRDDVPQAEQAFVQAGDRYAPAVYALARLHVRSGNNPAALVLIEKLRRDVPLDIATEMLAAQVFRELKNPVAAVRAAERAERSQRQLKLSDHLDYLQPIRSRYGLMARYESVQPLMKHGRMQQAAQAFRSALNGDAPEFTEGMFERGAHLSLMAGQPEAAFELLTRLQQRSSLSPPARHLFGDVLASMGRVEEAVQAWESANRLLPDPLSYRSLADARSQAGQAVSAERDLASSALFKGIESYRANELETAIRELEQARQVLKDDPRPSYYLGETWLGLSQLENARAAWRHCVELDPDHGRALERLEQLPK